MLGSLTIPATSLSDYADVPGVHVEGRVQLCKSATFVIPKGGLKPGNFDVAIENPSPAGCKSSAKVSLAVVPAPVVSALVPPAICDDQSDQVLGITGTGFLQIGAALPEVVLGAVKLVPTSLGGCSPVGTYAEGAVQSCTMIAIKVAKGTFAGGAYTWNLTQQYLTFMPVVMYRHMGFGRVVPFAGVGPRIYLMRSTVSGAVGSVGIPETTEQSTALGVGVPFGVELKVGPGGVVGEVLAQWGPFDHAATGPTHTGALSLSVGYRFTL